MIKFQSPTLCGASRLSFIHGYSKKDTSGTKRSFVITFYQLAKYCQQNTTLSGGSMLFLFLFFCSLSLEWNSEIFQECECVLLVA